MPVQLEGSNCEEDLESFILFRSGRRRSKRHEPEYVSPHLNNSLHKYTKVLLWMHCQSMDYMPFAFAGVSVSHVAKIRYQSCMRGQHDTRLQYHWVMQATGLSARISRTPLTEVASDLMLQQATSEILFFKQWWIVNVSNNLMLFRFLSTFLCANKTECAKNVQKFNDIHIFQQHKNGKSLSSCCEKFSGLPMEAMFYSSLGSHHL